LWDAIFSHGIEFLIRDRNQYWRRVLFETKEAESYRAFVEDFLAIKARSRSLNPAESATKLIRRFGATLSDGSRIS